MWRSHWRPLRTLLTAADDRKNTPSALATREQKSPAAAAPGASLPADADPTCIAEQVHLSKNAIAPLHQDRRPPAQCRAIPLAGTRHTAAAIPARNEPGSF